MTRTNVALIGPIGAGKTTIAQMLVAHHDYTRLSFAAPLKRFASWAYGEIDKDAIYRIRDPYFDDARLGELGIRSMTGRELLQLLGTEMVRQFDPDFWVRCLERELADTKGPIVVDDCRFENEYAMLRRHGFKFVRLTGRGTSPTQRSHRSELVQSGFVVDAGVSNAPGRRVEDVAREIAALCGPPFTATVTIPATLYSFTAGPNLDVEHIVHHG